MVGRSELGISSSPGSVPQAARRASRSRGAVAPSVCFTLPSRWRERAPPKGKRGSGAKKAGQGPIIADLARVMVAAARRKA